MRHLHLALILATAWSCGEPIAPSESRELIVGVVGSDSAPAGATQPTNVRLEGRSLVALGLLIAPSPCQEIRAFGVAQAFSLGWIIESRSRAGGCVDAVETFAYRLVARMDPDEYRVTVIHRYPGTGWPDAIGQDTVVRVP